jgi:L-lactate dehydrogenase complex protein LldG
VAREHILHKVRTALGRSPNQPPAPAPPPLLSIPDWTVDQRVARFRSALEALGGKTLDASSMEAARAYAASLVEGGTAVASNAAFLRECGITGIPGVRTGFTERAALRAACAQAGLGITSADYALAGTGTLVMIASPGEARLVSLLPPVHLAVIPRDRILTGLDELFTLLPNPSEQTSSMVLITGPSRTADIEQILVRGVHGPGEIHVVVV